MGEQSRRQFIRQLALATGLPTAKLVGGGLGEKIAEFYGYIPERRSDNKPNTNSGQNDSSEPLEQIADSDNSTFENEEKINYFAVSANENPVYVNLNLQVLRKHKYNAFIEKDSVSGLYRTVVATNLSREQLQRKLAEFGRFETEGMWERYYSTNSSKRLEELSDKIESKSNRLVNTLQKSQYIDQLKPLVTNAQTYDNGKEYSKLEPVMVLGLIFDAAHEFKVPLSEFTGIIYGESNFRNVKGDTNLGRNFSEGIGQMRKTTQEYVYNLMSQAAVPDLPERLPDSILPDPRLQARMSAFYFAHCIEKAGGDIKGGIAKYNAGQDSNSPNTNYVFKVQSRSRDITSSLQN